jgi:hypothetical protein
MPQSFVGTSSVLITNPFSSDAGGRGRISQITTLLDGKILGADDADLFQNIGTGTATYGSNKLDLIVTSGQYEIRQTKRWNPYFSGKSQLVECTFDNFQTQANTTKRVGYFSSNAVAPYASNFDGIFVEDNGTIKSLKIYRDGTLTVDVPFTSMDNYSAISSYDWSDFTVIAFDFLWLGGAVLRFFVKTQSGFELIHTVNYSGTAADTFTLSPNQPLRYEIRSTTGSGSLRYICSQVATEGSFNEAGKTLSLLNTTAVACNAIGTIYALKGVRKSSTYRDTVVRIIDISAGVSVADAGILMLLINPTVSAPLTWANNSRISEGTATTQTVTAGTGRLICAAPINEAGSSDTIRDNFLSVLSQQIDNTMDEFVLAYMPTTTNQSVYGIITIKEY